MGNEITITAYQSPRTKPAAKISLRNGQVRTWNESTQDKQKLQWQIKAILSEHHRELLTTDPCAEIRVKLRYYLPIPKSASQAEHNLMCWGVIPHITKPDNDNLTKFYGDVGNGILWPDDRQITCHMLRKRYSTNPRIEYTIEVVPNMLSREAKDILSIYSPSEVSSLIDDVWQMFELYDTSAERIEQEEDPYLLNQKLMKTACILSRIARNHSKKLNKIAKNHPDMDIQNHKEIAKGIL